MEVYKPGEAKLTRRVSFYTLLLLCAWGFKEFGLWIQSIKLGGIGSFFQTELISTISLPWYEQPLNLGVLLAIGLTIGAGYLLFNLLNGKKAASLLIDTEAEIRKVSWPSWQDAKQSTVIVLLFTIFTAVYLAGVEVVLNRIFGWVLDPTLWG